MMRLASISRARSVRRHVPGGRKVKVTRIDGATTDHALDAFVLDRAQLLDVSHVGQATRSNDRNGQGLSQLDGGVDVDAGQHAIATDVGVDDGFNAPIFELLGQVDHFVAGELAPAIGGDLAVLGIEAHDDVAAEGGAGVFQKAGVLDGRCADDHVAQTAIDVLLDGVQIADTAAELHRNVIAHCLEDGLDGRIVLGLAGKGAIEVDQVQAAGALVDPVQGHGGRVFTKGGGLVHVTLLEAHAVAVFEIDRGNELHGAVSSEWCSGKVRDSSEGSCGRASGRGLRSFRGGTGWQKYYRGQWPR